MLLHLRPYDNHMGVDGEADKPVSTGDEKEAGCLNISHIAL